MKNANVGNRWTDLKRERRGEESSSWNGQRKGTRSPGRRWREFFLLRRRRRRRRCSFWGRNVVEETRRSKPRIWARTAMDLVPKRSSRWPPPLILSLSLTEVWFGSQRSSRSRAILNKRSSRETNRFGFGSDPVESSSGNLAHAEVCNVRRSEFRRRTWPAATSFRAALSCFLPSFLLYPMHFAHFAFLIYIFLENFLYIMYLYIYIYCYITCWILLNKGQIWQFYFIFFFQTMI